MSQVLVVDDDETVASVVVSYLERAEHETRRVGDGQAALDAVASNPPDLMVLDLMLPEVCRRVRRTHADLPIIMLTALGEAEDRIAGLEVGADDYVHQAVLAARAGVTYRHGAAALGDDAPARREAHRGIDHRRAGRAPGDPRRCRARAHHA